MDNRLVVTAAPHITSADSTQKIMLRVCIALLPTLIASVIIFGVNALVLTLISVAACVAFEYLWCALRRIPPTTSDLSAVVTGILLAFNLPASMPRWMVLVGAFIAIIVVKQLFGGIGCNFANPAIVARIALAGGFAARMADYLPAPESGVDALSAATPLAANAGSAAYRALLLGTHAGVIGETCALTLIAGGLYLITTRVISPVIPVTYLTTAAVMSLLFGRDPIYQLLSGGILLGAIFMATDYVTSPTTRLGKLIYGVGLGVITCGIRFLGNANEGVSFAILLMNLLVPYIDAGTRQAKLGIAKPQKGGSAK